MTGVQTCALPISLVEEEGADVDGADRDGAEREGGATESNYRDLNYTSLRLTVTASMAHMKEKWSKKGKETKKWHKIRVIAKGKMKLITGSHILKHIYNGKNKM